MSGLCVYFTEMGHAVHVKWAAQVTVGGRSLDGASWATRGCFFDVTSLLMF